MNTIDTICAISSGAGGAIAIVRVSGKNALDVANKVWAAKQPLARSNARKMILGKIREIGDCALAVYMPGPNSYTGDDIVEIQCHGGALVSRRTLELLIQAGARLAEPGEFTFRAFVNGKMDLTQAEAVSDIISAGSGMALALAEKQLSGALSSRIRDIRRSLTDILGDLESRLDFPEEHIAWETPETLNCKIGDAMLELGKLADTLETGKCYRNGVQLTLAGRPNVGKSSLLNAILGRDRAIVSDIPGTTRDTLEEYAVIRNIPVKITDTAGIRPDADGIEALGIARSKQSLSASEIIFWVLDAAADDLPQQIMQMKNELQNSSAPVIAVWNKIDSAAGKNLPETGFQQVNVSAKTGENLQLLLDRFEETVWHGSAAGKADVAVNERQNELIGNAMAALAAAIPEIELENWELAAVQIRSAVESLGEITGENAGVDVLDNIFSRFCIGK